MGDDKDLAYSRILDWENQMCFRWGRSRMERYENNRLYYTGENLPPDNVEQPLKINYVRAINDKHTHYLWGEWQEDIVDWLVKPDDDIKNDALSDKITRYIYKLARRNEANKVLWDSSLDGSICGDSFLRLRWDDLEGGVVWENISPEWVHCRWNAISMDRIEEAVISYPIHRAEAQKLFGTPGTTDRNFRNAFQPMIGMAIYWEYWTPMKYEIWIDEECVLDAVNPYVQINTSGPDGLPLIIPGIVPFVHVPNLRAGPEFYGYGDTEGVQLLQDELNRKMADQGDIINNYAHPITVVNGFYGDTDELPVGPDAVWDLGRDGTAKLLTWEGTPPETQKYIENILQMLIDTSSMSTVAFGRHKGTQQAGIALAIEMLPITERAAWKRNIWSTKLRQLIRYSILIEERKGKDIGFTYKDLLNHWVQPKWAPILPRDRLALVNENIALVNNHLRTIERALEDLNEEHPDDQSKAILAEIKKLVEMGVKMQGINISTGAPVGSSSLPEGATKSKNEAGSGIKD